MKNETIETMNAFLTSGLDEFDCYIYCVNLLAKDPTNLRKGRLIPFQKIKLCKSIELKNRYKEVKNENAAIKIAGNLSYKVYNKDGKLLQKEYQFYIMYKDYPELFLDENIGYDFYLKESKEAIDFINKKMDKLALLKKDICLL